MIYQVVSPFSLEISADSIKEAIKNAVKIKRNINITEMIIKDQNRHIKAKLEYYQQDGRNKVGINMFPVGYNYPIPIVTNDTYVPPQIIQSPLIPMSPIPLSPVMSPFIPTVINIPNL